MVINIRSDGTEFDPADIRITKEMCPEIYELLDRMRTGGKRNGEQTEMVCAE